MKQEPLALLAFQAFQVNRPVHNCTVFNLIRTAMKKIFLVLLIAFSAGLVRAEEIRLPRKDYDQKAELWVAPALGYLPVRIKLTQANGDFADLQLSRSGPP